jgi:hypothetical protein
LNDEENRLFGDLVCMGKTVPSYRMVVEWEIANWKQFRNALASDEQKQAFDEMMDMCGMNAMAGSNACNPIIFEPMVMSILLERQKKLRDLEYKLNDAIWQKICAQPQTEPKANYKVHS